MSDSDGYVSDGEARRLFHERDQQQQQFNQQQQNWQQRQRFQQQQQQDDHEVEDDETDEEVTEDEYDNGVHGVAIQEHETDLEREARELQPIILTSPPPLSSLLQQQQQHDQLRQVQSPTSVNNNLFKTPERLANSTNRPSTNKRKFEQLLQQKDSISLANQQSNSECSICMDTWTSTGRHRITSLKCGHLFGERCVRDWIRRQGRQAACPICK
jgi:hypothetical protein